MKTVQYVYWQRGDVWMAHLAEYPDYWTQGQSLDDLRENLRDLHADLAGGVISEARRVAELQVA